VNVVFDSVRLHDIIQAISVNREQSESMTRGEGTDGLSRRKKNEEMKGGGKTEEKAKAERRGDRKEKKRRKRRKGMMEITGGGVKGK